MTNPTPKHGPELLPCPFCGGKAYRDRVDNQSLFWVACLECGIDGRICESAAEADAAWNRRSAIQQAAEPDLTAAYLLGRAEGVEKGAVPAGFRLVPVEPTREMLNAAIDVDSFKLGDISPLGFRMSPQQLFEKCYAAMLAASPTPPVGQLVAGGGVPLSDADIDEIAQAEGDYHPGSGGTYFLNKDGRFSVQSFAREIERRHGINPAGEGKV